MSLLSSTGTLKGVSIGTDVISSRVNHSKWVPLWKNNIQLLFQNQIPYSLTLTISSDLEFDWLSIWNWASIFEHKPQFIYLRYSEKKILEKWIRKIRLAFDRMPITIDDIGVQ